MTPQDFSPDETDTPETQGELVHWMGRGPLRVGPSDISVAAVAAFAFGIAAAFAALALFRWVAPRREGLPPWKWTRGPLH